MWDQDAITVKRVRLKLRFFSSFSALCRFWLARICYSGRISCVWFAYDTELKCWKGQTSHPFWPYIILCIWLTCTHIVRSKIRPFSRVPFKFQTVEQRNMRSNKLINYHGNIALMHWTASQLNTSSTENKAIGFGCFGWMWDNGTKDAIKFLYHLIAIME